MVKLTGNEVIGVDAGTQGISVVLYCPERRVMLGVGEAEYEADCVLNYQMAVSSNERRGRRRCHAQWYHSETRCAAHNAKIECVAGIGITGHMHCMVRE